MTKAIRIEQHGGPEVLKWVEVDVGEPGAGQLRVANQAIGLNFIDVYHRTGLYPLSLPSGIGQEGAGVVEAIGPGVTGFKVGETVAYAGPIGAERSGCHQVINYRTQNFVAEVKRLTQGHGVDVVYDAVGKDTFMGSLDCLRPLGLMVSYGNASGKAPPIDPIVLSAKGSLFLTRPTLAHYTAKREDLQLAAKALFHVIREGVVKAGIGQTYALKDAAHAHRDLEARKTTGSTVLLP